MQASPSEPNGLERLKTRIQALREKTVTNGCTESEALAAAQKVAELLDRHNLSLSDVDLRKSDCETRSIDTARKTRIPLDYCISAIAAFCDCKAWQEKDQHGYNRFVFFGLRQDVEVAHYLADMIDVAILTEQAHYKFTSEYQDLPSSARATATSSFGTGMAISISQKLKDMKAARDVQNAATGRDLVVVKGVVLDREFDKLGLKLARAKNARRHVAADAFDAGKEAGARFSLHPALRK